MNNGSEFFFFFQNILKEDEKAQLNHARSTTMSNRKKVKTLQVSSNKNNPPCCTYPYHELYIHSRQHSLATSRVQSLTQQGVTIQSGFTFSVTPRNISHLFVLHYMSHLGPFLQQYIINMSHMTSKHARLSLGLSHLKLWR